MEQILAFFACDKKEKDEVHENNNQNNELDNKQEKKMEMRKDKNVDMHNKCENIHDRNGNYTRKGINIFKQEATEDNTSKVSESNDTNKWSFNAIQRKLNKMKKMTIDQRKREEVKYVLQFKKKSNEDNICLIQSQWSIQYTQYLKGQSQFINMRPINNNKLLYRGQLSTKFKEKIDYLIIREEVWELVQALYGGGPIIKKGAYFPTYQLPPHRYNVNAYNIEGQLTHFLVFFQLILSIPQFVYYISKKLYEHQGKSKNKKVHHQKLFSFLKSLSEDKKVVVDKFTSFNMTEKDPIILLQTFMQLLRNDLGIQEEEEEFFFKSSNKALQNKQLFNTGENAGLEVEQYYAAKLSHRTILDRIFISQQTHNFTCSKCNDVRQTYHIQFVIQVNVKTTLMQSLRDHFNSQTILKQECHCHNKYLFNRKIAKTSNYMLIILNIFTKSGRRIEEKISFSQNMDVEEFTYGFHGGTLYHLVAVIVHNGFKQGSNDYAIYFKRKLQWFYSNQQQTISVNKNIVFKKQPYILLYQRQ